MKKTHVEKKKKEQREGRRERGKEKGKEKKIDLRLFKADELKQAHGFDYKAMATEKGFRPKKC